MSQTNAQNTTGQDSRSFMLDTTPPTISIMTPNAGSQSEGSLRVTGSCTTGLQIAFAGTGLASPFNLACNSAMFDTTINFSAGAGTKTITVSQTDAVGNVGSSSRNFERIAPILDGRILYANNCASCHQALATSTKLGRSASAITSAISSVREMNNIVLSSAQVVAIADVLAPPPDTTAPVIAILAPQNNALVRTALTISGTCESGLPVQLSVNGGNQNLTCTSGSFSVNYTLTQADGSIVLRATQVDTAGNTGTSPNITITKDTTAPTVAFTAPANNAQLSSQSLTVSGSCQAGLPVNITGSLLSADVQVNCATNNSFTANVSTVGTNGSYSLTLAQTDAAGNVGTVSRNVSVNIVLPAPTIAISNPAANSATRTSITLSGSCTNGFPVVVSGAGVNQSSQVTCNSGMFSAPITFSSGDGTKNIIVSQTNSQNTTGQDSRSFVLDTTPPAISIMTPNANTQSEGSLRITGSCTTGLQITFAGTGLENPFTLPCNSAMFDTSINLSAGTGVKAVTVSQTDAVGNVGSSSRNFERIAPILDGRILYANNCASCHQALATSTKIGRSAATITSAISSVREMNAISLSAAQISEIAKVLAPPPDTTAPVIAILAPQNNALVRTALTISGTCESGLPVQLSVNGGNQSLTCTSGTFSVNYTLTQADGSIVLRATQVDAAGNTGTSPSITINKDTVAPAVAFTAPANNAQLSSQSLAVSGSCESGLPVNISGSLLTASAQVSCTTNRTFTANVSTVGTNGSYVLTLTQTDAAGNVATVSRNVSVNILLPAPTIAISNPAANSATRTGITITGTCTNGFPVVVSGAGVNQTSQVNCNSGLFSAPITFSANDGMKNIIVSQTNSQNTTGQDSRSFLLDTTAPAVTIQSPVAGTSSETGLTISGNCETGRNITVAGTGVESSTTAPCNNAMFQTAITFSSGAGIKTVTVSQTDAVGNVGSNSRNFERLAPLMDGSILYANNCASCHQALASSTKINKTAQAISNAINTIPQMNHINLLPAQIDAVAQALVVAPAMNPYACNTSQAPDSLDAKRLTKQQTINAIRDLMTRAFGTTDANTIVTNSQLASRLPSDAIAPYSVSDSNFSALHAQGLFEAVDSIAKAVVTSANYTRFVTTYINYAPGTCTTINAASLSTACRDALIRNFLLRAWGRPIEENANNTNNELAAFQAAFQTAGTSAAGVEGLVYRAFLAPEFLFHLHIDVTASGSNYRLSSYMIARRLAFAFTQSLPSEALLTLARNGDLFNDTQFNEAVDLLAGTMNNSIDTFTREWLSLDRLPGYRQTTHPKYSLITQNLTADETLRTAMVDEIIELTRYVNNNNRPMGELFTSNISFARNSSLMRIYGQATAAPANVTEANAIRFPAGERSGLLTRAGMLFSGTHTENPVLRGVHVRKQIFCLTNSSPPPELGDQIATPVSDGNMTTRERYHSLTSATSCVSCHSQINPVGFAFSKYNAFGAVQTQEPIYNSASPPALTRYLPTDSRVNLAAGLGINQDVADGVELSSMVASSAHFKRCMTQNVQAFMHSLPTLPSTTNSCSMNRIYQALDGPTNSMRDVFKSAVRDSRFRMRAILK